MKNMFFTFFFLIDAHTEKMMYKQLFHRHFASNWYKWRAATMYYSHLHNYKSLFHTLFTHNISLVIFVKHESTVLRVRS